MASGISGGSAVRCIRWFAGVSYEKGHAKRRIANMSGEWIPVTERLPDLVNSKDARYVTEERYSDPVLVFDGSEVHVGTYGDVEGWLSGYETLDSVTHWMPLPAPPTDAK